MSYRDDATYKTLEKMCHDAGIKIVYQPVPDDSIDGEIWARADCDSCRIMMPDSDCFDSDERACLILGHEMAHILTGADSPDVLPERVKNEAICDLLGYHLYTLADMIAGHDAEQAAWGVE